MSTECADTLNITGTDSAVSLAAHWQAAALALGTALRATARALHPFRRKPLPARRREAPHPSRYEAFETRSDDLGDLLRGGILPRIPDRGRDRAEVVESGGAACSTRRPVISE